MVGRCEPDAGYGPVTAAMNLRVSWKAGNFLNSWVTASEEGLCSMELVTKSADVSSEGNQVSVTLQLTVGR